MLILFRFIPGLGQFGLWLPRYVYYLVPLFITYASHWPNYSKQHCIQRAYTCTLTNTCWADFPGRLSLISCGRREPRCLVFLLNLSLRHVNSQMGLRGVRFSVLLHAVSFQKNKDDTNMSPTPRHSKHEHPISARFYHWLTLYI